MSRIHEALLKAQSERGVQNEELEPERLALEAPELPTDGAEATLASLLLAKADRPNTQSDAEGVSHFVQRHWRPDVERLLFLKPESSVGIEEFRVLRSRLFRERTQRHLKTVLITGANPGEGKTFVAANLAFAIARHPGSRVLLIDGDLRRSAMHSLFGMQEGPGLTDFLTGEENESAIVGQTPEPQLCVVTAGKKSRGPTDLLQSPRMQDFMERMSRSFDWILVDSPPAGMVSDSTVLSEFADGVLLVIAPGTTISVARKTRKEFAHKPILGVVLNRAEAGATYYDYYQGTGA